MRFRRNFQGRAGWERAVAIGAVSLALLAGGAAVSAWDGARTSMTEVLHTTCDISGSQADMALPLDLLRSGSGNLPLRIGPLGSASAEPGITLEFRPAAEGEAEVLREAEVISLPMLEDLRGRSPRRVILACREDRVATVRYEFKDGSRRELPVPAAGSPQGAARPEQPERAQEQTGLGI